MVWCRWVGMGRFGRFGGIWSGVISWVVCTVGLPRHDPATRQALAEAFALVAYGRTDAVRARLRRDLSGAATISEPWLRALVQQLRRSPHR
jgi:hypothetical protein